MKNIIIFLALCACRGPQGDMGPAGPQGKTINVIPVPLQTACSITAYDEGVVISCTNGVLVRIPEKHDKD